MVSVLLVTNHVVRRLPLTGGERLIPATVTELGRCEIGVLQEIELDVDPEDKRTTHCCNLVEFTLEGETEAVEICATRVTRAR